jgi:hypothetical protein
MVYLCTHMRLAWIDHPQIGGGGRGRPVDVRRGRRLLRPRCTLEERLPRSLPFPNVGSSPSVWMVLRQVLLPRLPRTGRLGRSATKSIRFNLPVLKAFAASLPKSLCSSSTWNCRGGQAGGGCGRAPRSGRWSMGPGWGSLPTPFTLRGSDSYGPSGARAGSRSAVLGP